MGRRMIAISLVACACLLAFRAGAATLLSGRVAKFADKPGPSLDKAIIKFVKDAAIVAPLADPTCPGSSSLRLVTDHYDSGEILLDCALWSHAGAGYKYSDPLTATLGLQKILVKPSTNGGKLLIKMKGPRYGADPIGGPIDYFEARLTLGGEEYCGRFEDPPSEQKTNEVEKMMFKGPSTACVPLTPTPTETETPTPSDTPTATPTATTSDTPTITPTATQTDTPTITPTATQTGTPTNTPTITPTGGPSFFRVDSLALRDPHILAQVGSCVDVTETDGPLGALFSINGSIADAITMDGDMDGLLDFSTLYGFRPLNQPPSAGADSELRTADCTTPLGGETCSPDANQPVAATYTNANVGVCLQPLAGTTGPGNIGNYMPPVSSAPAPCFSQPPTTATFTLAGIEIPLVAVRLAATYVGNPASSLSNGLIVGFLAESTADTILLPPTVPLFGNQPLSVVLPGGTGNCALHDDRDVGPGGALGWYFYLNFSAHRVTWTGP